MNRTALITGATSGIGKATAEKFAKEGIRLIVCGRRESKLKELAEKLADLTEVYQLCFDVRDKMTVVK